MSVTNSRLVLGKVPEAVRSQADAAGLTDKECLFGLRSDLGLDGEPRDVWLVVARDRVVTLDPDGEGVLSGPFMISKVKKVRAFQSVGSVSLQFLMDGLYVDVIRYSNAGREMFDRARLQLERMAEGEDFQEEALSRPSMRVCNVCGLPLPGRGAPCPRCSMRKGIFRRTLGLMRPYRPFVALLLVLMIVGVGLDLVPPQLQRAIVDRIILPATSKDPVIRETAKTYLLIWIVVGLVAAAGGRQLLNIFIGRTSSYIGTRITRELRERLERKLVGVSVDYYDRHAVGSLMSRVLYDVDNFQGFVVQVAHGFLLNVMLVMGIGTMLFVMNWRLAFLVLLPIPFVVLGTTFFWRHIYPRYYRLWDSQSKMAQLLTGLFSGIRLVKIFGQEAREHERFSRSAAYMQSARRSVEMSVATFNPIMAFVFSLGGFIIWYAGTKSVLLGGMSLGTLMAFFGYLGMFYSPISALSMFSNWVTSFLTAGQRVFEVLDATSGVPEEPNPVRLPEIAGGIEFRNVTFGYDPYNPVIKNVSLKIAPGQFVGIVGKSGSGKTSLVNLLCRFYDVQQGEVLIDGVDVRKIELADLHSQVALVLQEPFLFRASIADNIAYGRPEAGPVAVLDAAKSANAHDFVARMPAGYDTQLGERGAGLSGGERQRVSIARALLCNPKILVLDEATSSVDTESEQEIQRALSVLGKGRTTIAIAHRLSTLKNADHIYVVDDGRIVENGTHEALLEQKGVYYKLVKIQTQLTRLEVE